MGLIPEDVRCVVCKNIFCCLECRNRHEMNAHNPNDVLTERNRLRCGLCQGYQTLEFQCRNDFALIMHLSQAHLPLHCRKCLTQFNSIADFSASNKCAHLNDGCSLQSPKQECSNNNSKIEKQSDCVKDTTSNTNFITAVQKSSFERSISDSVVSLRNYSTILHTSNHPLYKTQSPDAMGKALVRQTSTPMHHNLLSNKSPDSKSCSSCLVSSTSSGQISNINSSSDLDMSSNQTTNSNDVRQNVHQQSIMVTQKKTTTIKRSRHSLTVTPLTRQVMTKSIHRAILQYQNTQHGVAVSPKSPLDLRVRTAITRDDKDNSKSKITTIKSKTSNGKSPNINNDDVISRSILFKSNSLDSNSKLSQLETVYEQEKDVNAESIGYYENDNCISSYESVEVLCHDHSTISNSIKETPSRKLSNEKLSDADNIKSDIWYTPKEYIQSNIIENVEVYNNNIYTPKISKKRAPIRRIENVEEVECDYEPHFETQLLDGTKSEPQKNSTSKIWSMVSTFFRFASITPTNDLSMPVISANDTDSHLLIKRCSSFTGILRENNTSTPSDDEEYEVDPLQPIKRRRITSIDSTLGQPTVDYRKRIMCRPPIRRMLNN